ncbi:nucleotidyltransferase family protein [Pseudocolwellia sp. HL-MZ19]|uniref:nucleotidyltransferase family protein n=1 Tax=Pseudocolwellia sp. HL-MZ19 TaxID=3400846 RepID=UPI003CF10CB4
MLQNTFELNKHWRLSPLILRRINSLLSDEDKSCTNTYLSKQVQSGFIREMAKDKQLNEIIDLLDKENIKIILLKGTAFSKWLFSAEAPRLTNDIDILIKKADWLRAEKLLSQVMVYTEKTQPDVFGDLYEISFKPRKNVGAALDLHRSLTHPILFNIDESALWESSLAHPFYTRCLMLCPEHALIHQAVHAYKDMNFEKYNLIDSIRLISELNSYDKLFCIAKSWGASVPLYILLMNCLSLQTNKELHEQMKKNKPKSFVIQITKYLLNSDFKQPRNNRKCIRYRIHQVISQFIFTSSIKRPAKLQVLFVYSFLKNMMAGRSD